MPTLELTLTAPKSGGGDPARDQFQSPAAPDGEFGRHMARALAPEEKTGANTNAEAEPASGSGTGFQPVGQGEQPGKNFSPLRPRNSTGKMPVPLPEPEVLPQTNPTVEKSSGDNPAGPPEKLVVTDQKTPADFIVTLFAPALDLNPSLPAFFSLPLAAQFTAAGGEKTAAEVPVTAPGIVPVTATKAAAGAVALPDLKTAPAAPPGRRVLTPEKMASANLPGATAMAAVKTAALVSAGGPALTTGQLAPPVWPDARTLADGKNASAILPGEPAVTTAKTAALVLPAGMALAAGKYASAILPGEPALAADKTASPGRRVEPFLAAEKTAPAILPDAPVAPAAKMASAILPDEPALAAGKIALLIASDEPALTATNGAPPVLPAGMALASEKNPALTVPGGPAWAAGKTAPPILPDEPVGTIGKLAGPVLAGGLSLVTGKIPAPVLPVEPAVVENPAARFLGEVPAPAASAPEKIISRSDPNDAVTVAGKIIPPPLPELKPVPEKPGPSRLPVEQGTTAIAPTMKDFVPPAAAAAVPEKFEMVSNGSLSRAAEGAGTGVATVDSPMKKTGNTNKVAGLDAKVLPGGTFDAARERVLPSLASVAPERRAENRSSDFILPLPVANAPLAGPADAQNSIRLPSLLEARLQNVERTHDLVALHALRLVESKGDSMSVVIKPGAGTELSLELRHRNGGVEAAAILQRGDYQLLNAHWPELQQKLELRGIKLGPLGGEGNFSSPDNGNFSRRQSSREEAAQQASAFAEFTMAVNPKGATARHASSGWESWA